MNSRKALAWPLSAPSVGDFLLIMKTSIGASSAFSASYWVPRSGKGKKSSWSRSALLPLAVNSSEMKRPKTIIPACLRSSWSAPCSHFKPANAGE